MAISTPSTLLLGDTGSGKTHSLVTFLDAGIELFVLITEPNGLDTLLDAARGRDLALLHYKVIAPVAPSLSSLMQSADLVNRKSAGDIQRMDVGLNKIKYQQYTTLLHTIQNFTCDRTGISYGDVTEWGDDRAFSLDSLSGLNYMIRQHISGDRPTLTLPEYGLAQNLTINLLNVLTSINAYFVLTAHIENAVDELGGGRKLFPIAIGNKLAPELPRFFSEVVLTLRSDNNYLWNTNATNAVVKHRALPLSDKITPSFKLVVEAHKKRKLLLEKELLQSHPAMRRSEAIATTLTPNIVEDNKPALSSIRTPAGIKR